MTYFHQLWDRHCRLRLSRLRNEEIQRAQAIGAGSEREREFINALSLIYRDGSTFRTACGCRIMSAR